MSDASSTIVNAVTINDNVLTAMVGYTFVCIVRPKLVRHKAQFYAAFLVILFTMLLGTISWMFNSDAFGRLATVLRGFTEIVAFVLLVMSTGGLSLSELAGEVGGAIEVIRRGETEKTYIIPQTGERPKPRPAPAEPIVGVDTADANDGGFDPIDRSPTPASTPVAGRPVARPPSRQSLRQPPKDSGSGSIPLD